MPITPKTILHTTSSFAPEGCPLELHEKDDGKLRVVDSESKGSGKQYPLAPQTGRRTAKLFKEVCDALDFTGVGFGNAVFDFYAHRVTLDDGLVLFLEMFWAHWRVRVHLPDGSEVVIETVSNGLCFFGALSTLFLIAAGFCHWGSFTSVMSPPAKIYKAVQRDGAPTGIAFSGAYSGEAVSNPYIWSGFHQVDDGSTVVGAAPAATAETDAEMARRLQGEYEALKFQADEDALLARAL